MKTPICGQVGVEFPLFAFSHCRDVVVAVGKAGGFGVLGAVGFTPEALEVELKWIDERIGGRRNEKPVAPATVRKHRGQNARIAVRVRYDATLRTSLTGSSWLFTKANGIANTAFVAGDAAAIFAGLDAAFVPADTVVVIDPPRKGCDERFLQQLFAFGPRAVVYVSCDPATQMRDLKTFLAAGYTLTAAQPFDLFPQTRHLECVLTLRRLDTQARR